MKIDGEHLGYLRLTDDICICASTPYELQQMLQELPGESNNRGLKMNKSKAKVIIENSHKYTSTTPRSGTLKDTSTWDRDRAAEKDTST